MRYRLALTGIVLAGCVSSHSVVCGDGRTCPETDVCDDTHMLCVTPEQVSECSGMADGTACMLEPGVASCHDGVCLPSACGNGRVDPGEDCDDGNQKDGDGCSASCTSNETCGNGVIDTIKGELCDDGNNLDHDGCSSTCQLETLDWAHFTDPGPLVGMVAAYDAAHDQVVMFSGFSTGGYSPVISSMSNPTSVTSIWHGVWQANLAIAHPPDRYWPAMAYDAARGRVVLYGGTLNGAGDTDTWEWDGAAWKRGPDAPTGVFGAVMTYDSRRHKIVMFGGTEEDNAPHDSTTYEYDGTSWVAAPTINSPEPRYDAQMTYDPERGVVVMYGGFVGGFVGNEVWEYDGQTWTNRTPPVGPNGPPDLTSPAFAYSAALHKCVLYGGINLNTGVATMYEWDGTAWTTFTGATPPARGAHVMTEDGRGGLFVFGGEPSVTATSSALLSDTWGFDGTKWTQLGSPGIRTEFAIATAFDQRKTVLFGGATSSTVFPADTWELSDHGWAQGTAGPPATTFPEMVYDEARKQFVLFGGLKNNTTLDNTTWLRGSNGTWTSVHPTTSPAGRGFHGMAYDAKHGVTLLYGGVGGASQNTPLPETWQWDGAAWTQLFPAHTPTAIDAFAIGYDPVHGVVVITGGANGAATVNETWIWDGTDWHNAMPSTYPTYRSFASHLVWDPARRSLVEAGGLIALADVFDAWEWITSDSDPTTGQWQLLLPNHRPSGRFAGAFSTLDGSAVALYGGTLTGTGTIVNELWELREDGTRPTESCALGTVDADGDGLAGCADPDCWTVCTPDCPPGTSCSASTPQCGNGVCDALENCHTCPQDCPTCEPVCGDFICDPGEVCVGDC